MKTRVVGIASGPGRVAHLCVVVLAAMGLASNRAEAQAQGPYSFFPLTPCRVVDTRAAQVPGVPVQNGPPALTSSEPRYFRVLQLCGVPLEAKAVALVVVAYHPAYGGHLVLWPATTAEPLASVLNYSSGDVIANGVILPVSRVSPQPGVDNDIAAKAFMGPTGTVDVIIDVTGYFK